MRRCWFAIPADSTPAEGTTILREGRCTSPTECTRQRARKTDGKFKQFLHMHVVSRHMCFVICVVICVLLYVLFFFFSGDQCPLCGKFTQRMNEHMLSKHKIRKDQYRCARDIKAAEESDHKYLLCPICSTITRRLDRHIIGCHKMGGEHRLKERKALCAQARQVSF